MATVGQWIEGARPRTLPNAIAPVLAGTGAAAWLGSAVWWKALLALLVSLPVAQAQTQAPAEGKKVLKYAFRVAETSVDPAQITDLYSRTVTPQPEASMTRASTPASAAPGCT